jgi:hypothetical protein
MITGISTGWCRRERPTRASPPPPRQRRGSLPSTLKRWIFPARSNPYGPGRGGRRLHHGKGSLEAGPCAGCGCPQVCWHLFCTPAPKRFVSSRLWSIPCYPMPRKDMGATGAGRYRPCGSEEVHWGQLAPGTKLGPSGPIFPRAEKDTVERMHELETNNTGKSAEAETTSEAAVMTSAPAAPEPAPQPTPAANQQQIAPQGIAAQAAGRWPTKRRQP